LLLRNETGSRDERSHFSKHGLGRGSCSLMMLTRLAVGLEPLNAPDAAHRSPRSVRFSRTKFGFPVESATRRSIKRNKELVKRSICFPRLPKSKLRCSFASNRVALDE
jgi:hypothetical protein